MENASLQNILNRFQSIVENPHHYALSLKKRGFNLAGYMCTHVPEEILYAYGFVPLRIITSRTPQAISRSFIHETYCSFCHDCAYEGLMGRYDYLDLLVSSSSCIHMGEAFNVWVEFAGFSKKSFLLSYPHILHTNAALELINSSYEEFKKFIEGYFKRSVRESDLERSIRIYNRTRRLLKKLWESLKEDASPITGVQAATITLASQLMEKEEFNEMLERLIELIEKRQPRRDQKVRIMVSGGACDNMRLFALIELQKYGAKVVFIDSCTASRYFWFEVPEGKSQKTKAIAEGYINRIPCPAKDNVPGTGEKKRFSFLKQFIEEYKPDGAIFIYQRFCSPQPMDVVSFKPILERMGIPYTELELDTTIPTTRFTTQIEGLLEIIRGIH